MKSQVNCCKNYISSCNSPLHIKYIDKQLLVLLNKFRKYFQIGYITASKKAPKSLPYHKIANTFELSRKEVKPQRLHFH